MSVGTGKKELENRSLGFYVLIELMIAYIGFCLLVSNNHRNHFYSYFRLYISDEAKSSQYAELTLIILSIWMISILFATHLYVKFVSIFSFALYNTLSHHFFLSKNYTQDIGELVINFLVVYLAIEGSFQLRDIGQEITRRRQKIIDEQNYLDQGWYPLQLPIEDNDMESQQKQTHRMDQLLNRNEDQILGLMVKIKESQGKQIRKKLKKMRQHQFDKHYKDQIKKIKQSLLYKQLESSSKPAKRQSVKENKKSKVKTF